jgi:MYXO-CTERM domain-containing protein
MSTDTTTRRWRFGAFALLVLAGLLVGGYIAEPTFLDGFKAVLAGLL